MTEGTMSRRQATDEIAGIVERLASMSIRLHGFGVKAGGLQKYAPHLVSADSLAWSFRARMAARHGEGRDGRLCRSGTHASCANCYEWAHAWHSKITETLEDA